MKGIIAVVMLAIGIVLGFSAGLLIRDPSLVRHPRTLLEDGAPSSCLQVVEAASDMSQINRAYLSLVRQTYLPMLQRENATQGQASAGAPTSPAAAVDEMLAASQRLADLSDRTASATAKLDDFQRECQSLVDR